MTNKTPKFWSLYRITNLINKKVYIGQAADLSKRWSDHRRAFILNKPTQVIHHALIKYGLDNFEFEVIANCKTQDDANEIETQLVSQYDSFIANGKGYNATLGGTNAPKSDQWIQAMKDWHASLSAEERAEISKKQSEATQKQIEIQGHPAQGTKRTPEQSKTLSQARKDHPVEYTLEIRQKMSESHIGKVIPEEQRKKMAESIKDQWKIRGDYDSKKCQAPGCEIFGKAKYKIIDGIRYCFNHGQNLKRNGTLEKIIPNNSKIHLSDEERKIYGLANIGRAPINKITFNEDQMLIICNLSRSIKSLSREFKVTEKVIVRVRK